MEQFAKTVEEIRGAGYRIHDGMFSYRAQADAAVAALRERGIPATVQSRRQLGGVGYVVRCQVDGRWQDLF